MSDQASNWDHPTIPPPPPRLEQPINPGNGRFMPNRNQHERDAWAAARWTIDGWTLQEIANALGLSGKPCAHRYVQRGLRGTREQTAATTEQARAAHRTNLSYALEVALDVMAKEHTLVSHGRVIKDDDGNPMLDYAPLLAAAGKVKELSESLRRLDGLDQPVKVDATVTEVTQQDIELQEMIREAKARTAMEEQALRGQAEA